MQPTVAAPARTPAQPAASAAQSLVFAAHMQPTDSAQNTDAQSVFSATPAQPTTHADAQSAHPAATPSEGAPTQHAEGYWRLIDKGEPYRLLFPLGTALGVIGVLLWVSYLLKWQEAYPGIMHARIMIQGFLGAFAFGFLGTAFPRLTETPRLRGWVSLTLAAGLTAGTLLHLANHIHWGDGAFVLTFLFFLAQLGTRIAKRADNPPPGFVLVAFGLIGGLIGAIGLFASAYVRLSPFAYSMCTLLLYQGFMLMPVMGIGAFLLPRFFALPNKHNFPESLRPSKEWLQRAAFALLCALLVVGSFALEAAGYIRSGNLLRALVVFTYIGVEIPVHRAKQARGSLSLALRISLLCVPLGYLFVAAFPLWRIAWLHILFITGFSLITLTVATRVILGHSGQSPLFQARLRSILIMTACMVLALLTRISADWMPDSQLNHYAYAALTWAAGAIIWAIAFFPALRIADDE